jgi:5-methylthioadenosine/S-adenosylhomocysteine deaminase
MILKNARFVVTPKKVLENADVLTEGSRIAEIGKDIGGKENPDGIEIDAGNKLVMPGLVNTHTHSAMTLFRGAGDDMELMEWLKTRIWPMESKLSEDDVYWGSLLACIEMLKSGTTAFCDMYFFMDAVAKACEKAGIRGALSWAIVDREFTTQKGDPVGNCERFIKRWESRGLVSPSAGPHSIYTCSGETLLRAKEAADKYNTLLHIHLSETRNEVEDSVRKFGKRPAGYLESIGFLDERVLAAHCVWLDSREIELLKKRGVGVVHCPVSNMKLASGVAPVPEMVKKGLTVSLGTDGACSNNSLDMFETMKITALLHKVEKMDPTVLKAGEVLGMATSGGAKTLGVKNTGTIEAGKKADLLVLDIKKVNWSPVHNPVSNLIYSAKGSDVETVVVDGKVVVEKGKVKTVDEDRVIEKAERIRERLSI